MSTPDDRWRALSEYSDVMSNATSVEGLAACTLETALDVLQASSASLSRFEIERGRVRILHNRGDLTDWEEPWPKHNYYPVSEYQQLMTTAGSQARSWRGSLDDPATAGPDRAVLERLTKRHAASFRVSVADTAWGDLYVTRADQKPFGVDELAVGEVLAGLLSAGLSRLELLDDLASLAYTDPLTGLGNRRATDEWLEKKLSGVDDSSIAAILCDVNGLKRINDSLGHTAGDELLKLAARDITTITAAEGLDDVLVARLGGDEFLVLIGAADRKHVERLERRLADLRFPHNTGLAVGAAMAAPPAQSGESSKTAARSLLRLADAAQYQHKQARQLSLESMTRPSAGQLWLESTGVMDDGLSALQGMTQQSVLHRLNAVCAVVAERYDVASWWVSSASGSTLLDVLGAVTRPDSRGDLSGIEFTSGTPFEVSDYPATAAALKGGSYHVSLTEGDEQERAFLARMGYLTGIAAGETDHEGVGWLVEMFADPQTSPALFSAEPCLRALTHIAVRWRTELNRGLRSRGDSHGAEPTYRPRSG